MNLTTSLKCNAVFGLLLAAVGLSAQTLTTLHSFIGTDGSQPDAPLLQARNGQLYGTTFAGGAHGDGTVFAITTDGSLTTIHSFNHLILGDGGQPLSGLMQASNGNLYGTTTHGGASRTGSMYKIAP